MNRLDGKIAIITGAARGMGASHARLFVEEGARVVVVDQLVDAGQALADALGEGALFMAADVTQRSSWASVVQFVEGRFGPPDVLVNNAGIMIGQSIEEATEADYRRVIDVNQVGVYLGMQAVIPSMRRLGRGSIVNVGSTASMVGFADYFAYTASKWAVRGMTKAAATQLAPHGIRVNAVHPGDVATEMTAAERATGEITTDRIAMGRFGEPGEISQAVLYLASDDSSYVTGSDLVADGGYTAV